MMLVPSMADRGWEPIHWAEEADGLHAEAFLSPADWLSDRGELYLFINGRPIRNKTITSAIRNGYQNILGQHHEPSGALYLEMKTDWVDVNVHPQKWEVRILRQEAVYAWLMGAIKRHLPVSLTPLPQSASTLFPNTETNLAPALFRNDSRFFLLEHEKALFVIDRHLMTETLRYEDWQRDGLGQKQLHRPLMYRRALADESQLKAYQEAFETVKLEARYFGDGDWAIQAIPSALSETDLVSFLDRVFLRLESHQSELCLAELACLTSSHCDEGWLRERVENYRARLEKGVTCPHGRPVAYRVSQSELERFFGECRQP